MSDWIFPTTFRSTGVGPEYFYMAPRASRHGWQNSVCQTSGTSAPFRSNSNFDVEGQVSHFNPSFLAFL